MPGFVFVFVIGAILGFAARLVYPGRNTVHGFILTTVLGTIGAAAATSFARSLRWAEPNQLANITSMFVGAIVVLFVWNRLVIWGIVPDPGLREDESGR
jgi:uncharacterized membrane protein YeaQ/YmgE (transglycosylase-associated protein family)